MMYDCVAMTPKNRPSRRRRIIAAIALPIALLVAALAWVILEVRAVYVAEPVIAVNYREKFRTYAKEVAGADAETADRAWAILLEAAARSDSIHREYDRELEAANTQPRFDGDSFVADYMYVRDAIALTPDMEREWEAIRRLRAAGVFDTLAAFADVAPGVAPAGDNTLPILFEFQPLMASLRHLARARVASMRLAHAQSDWAEVARGFDQALAIGRTAVNSPGVIWSMVGAGIHSAAIMEARHLLMEGDLNADACLAMLRSLERHALPPPAFGIEAERGAMLDLLQRIYSDDGEGDGYLAPKGVTRHIDGSQGLNSITALRSRFFVQTRRETTELVNRWFDVHLAPVPEEEYRQIMAYFDSGENLIASTIAPALGRYVQNSRVLLVDVEGLRVMLMLEMHRDRRGSYPTSLRDLDSEFELPIDRFSSEPFQYRLKHDDPHGRPYLLYSLGVDRQDDGGRDVEPGVDRGRVLTSPRYAGYDYIINPPRPGVRW